MGSAAKPEAKPDLQMLPLRSDDFRVSADFLIRGHEYGENPQTQCFFSENLLTSPARYDII